MIFFLSKLMFSGWNFTQKEVIKLILLGITAVIAVISVIVTRKYHSYEGKFSNSMNFVNVSSKGWIIVAVVFGVYGAIACLVSTIQAVRNLPKVCNKCNTVTKNQYTVCKNCLSKNDFTFVNAESIVINDKYKTLAIVLTVITTLLYIISGFVN